MGYKDLMIEQSKGRKMKSKKAKKKVDLKEIEKKAAAQLALFKRVGFPGLKRK